MIDAIGFDSIVDIGFILLVSMTCWQSLMSNSDATEGRRKQWKEELGALETSMRELIREAGVASGNLNRNLIKRREELELLLGRLEATDNETGKSLQQPKQPSIQKASVDADEDILVDDDLPNASWARPLKIPTEAASDSLAALSDARQDKVSLSAQAQSQTRSSSDSLRAQIETIRDEAEKAQKLTSASDSSVVDPAAYNIARRLLADGKEIHVVARKLELPVAEVRMIDKMLRQELSMESSESFEASEDAPREQASTTALTDESDTIETLNIERQTALL